jgi:hypothetical protein
MCIPEDDVLIRVVFFVLLILLCASSVHATACPSGTGCIQYVQAVGGANVFTIAVTITGVQAGSVCIADFIQSITAGTFTSGTVKDNIPNTYTMTTSSPLGPVQTASDQFVQGIAYLDPCPTGSSTVTWTATMGGSPTSTFNVINVYEYHKFAAFSFDKDANHTWPSTGTGANCLGANCLMGNPASLPSITPTNPGEALIGQFVTDQGGSQATTGDWSFNSVTGDYFYMDARGTSTSANFSDTGPFPDSAADIIAAFKGIGCAPGFMLLHAGGPC